MSLMKKLLRYSDHSATLNVINVVNGLNLNPGCLLIETLQFAD